MLPMDIVRVRNRQQNIIIGLIVAKKYTSNFFFIFHFLNSKIGCSEEEIRTVISFEDERHNSGNFRLLYPHPTSVNSHKRTIREMKLDSVLPEYVDHMRKF